MEAEVTERNVEKIILKRNLVFSNVDQNDWKQEKMKLEEQVG